MNNFSELSWVAFASSKVLVRLNEMDFWFFKSYKIQPIKTSG
jgi:hypothetical protein